MKKKLIPIGALLVTSLAHTQNLPTTENYIQTRTYLEPVTISSSTAKQIHTVQYFDGLGRPKQVVGVKASPLGRDVVSPIAYDGFGRPTRDYLPVPQLSTNNGAIYTQTPGLVDFPVGDPTSTYTNEIAFSEKVLENSPLDRIHQQIQVGTDWLTKPVKFEYKVNSNEEIKKYVTITSIVDNSTHSTLKVSDDANSSNGFYKEKQLYKNLVKDEDGNETIEFKNGQGQTLLVRKVISATENADTYYVYNEYNQLAFVIPPKASDLVKSIVPGTLISEILLNDLCYQYRYDGRNRLVEKKLPGKGWEYFVYDKTDRLILSQDANLKGQNKWQITKYDQFGRVSYTGFLVGGERAARQQEINNAVITESRNATGFTRNGMTVYYTDNYFIGEIPTILTVNYYDTYPNYSFNPAFPTDIFGLTLTDNPTADGKSSKGLPVMSLVKNIEDDNWTKNYSYYDTRGRVVGTYSINYLGGFTETKSELDFAGVTKQNITRHKRLNSDTEKVITETFEYDHQNRLLVHKHKIDNNTEEILAQNKYNELSQLESKKVGGASIVTPLQTVDYEYNIRGWMTKINNPVNLGNDLFGYKINYNTMEGLETPNLDFPDLKVKPQYNGNIAEVSWRTSTTQGDNLRRYGYTYDNLNRLLAGFYQKDSNPSGKEYFEKLDYDLNGNITNLKRSAGLLQGDVTALNIDNLTYTYTGNILTKVTDATQNSLGYPSGGNIIEYDANGNMTKQKDKNINKIIYNYLNLIVNVNMVQGGGLGMMREGNIIDFKYRADGVKIEKNIDFVNPYTQDLTNVNYLEGFQYERKYNKSNTAQQGYDSGYLLQFIPTSEGYFDFQKNRYIYNYTDHLGNVRLAYYKDVNNNIVIDKETNYYPFGLEHSGYNGLISGLQSYKYQYNGKELQENGMYDYGARMYMPDLGRWGVVDPLVETTMQPYAYANNNPIRFVDPTGMIAEEANNSKWIPTIQFDKDKNGNLTGGHLALKMEKGDNAESLAKTLNISQKEANKLFNGMQKNGNTSVDVPENIAGSINTTITDAVMNSGDYGESKNYNCFACSFRTATGEGLKADNFSYIMSPSEFQSYVKAGFDKAGANEKIFGKTMVTFKGMNESKIFGVTVEKTIDLNHAATYLGTSRNGTEYTFSKNGMYQNPKIETTSSLKAQYGNKVGYWNKSGR